MKLTNEQIAAALDVTLAAKESGMLGYAIMCNTRKMREAAQEYLKKRAELFEKYGRVTGATVVVPAENVEAFRAEMGDIPKVEHEIDVTKVSLETFTGGSLTNTEMEALYFMLEDQK